MYLPFYFETELLGAAEDGVLAFRKRHAVCGHASNSEDDITTTEVGQ